MTPFPTITTERLILREITPADATAMYEYLSDPEVTKQMALDPYESSKAIADEEIRWYHSIREQGTGIRWGITLKDENIVIGSCGFLNRAKKTVVPRSDLSYILLIGEKGLLVKRSKRSSPMAFTHTSRNGLRRLLIQQTLAPDKSYKSMASLKKVACANTSILPVPIKTCSCILF